MRDGPDVLVRCDCDEHMLRATYGNVAMLMVQSKSPPEAMRSMGPFALQLMRSHPRVALYVQILDGVAPPSREAQRVAAEVLQELTDSGAVLVAQCIEKPGFWGAAVRAFQTGVNMLVRTPLPTRSCASVPDALDFMELTAKRLDLKLPDRAGLERAIRELRSEARLLSP